MTNKNSAKWKAAFGVVLVIMFCMSLEGCTSVRRKFVRKKKNVQEEEVIPVLNPIDYPPPVLTSMDRYQQFYDMFRIWQKDILMTLDERPSDKQILYKLSQMAVQMEGMKGLIKGEALNYLKTAISEYEGILAAYEKPAAFRSAVVIKGRVKKVGDMVLRNLKSDLIKKDLIN